MNVSFCPFIFMTEIMDECFFIRPFIFMTEILDVSSPYVHIYDGKMDECSPSVHIYDGNNGCFFSVRSYL